MKSSEGRIYGVAEDPTLLGWEFDLMYMLLDHDQPMRVIYKLEDLLEWKSND